MQGTATIFRTFSSQADGKV